MNDPYPVTIVRSRYGGTYEPGRWLAWPLYEDQLPIGWAGGDAECHRFWSEYRRPVGSGDTPQDAYDDLLVKIAPITPNGSGVRCLAGIESAARGPHQAEAHDRTTWHVCASPVDHEGVHSCWCGLEWPA